MFFKCKIGDKIYQLDKLTLGEARVLKRDFGLTDLAYFSNTDPDVIVGLLALAIRRADPSLSLEDATTEAEGLDIEEFDPNVEPEPEEESEAPLGEGQEADAEAPAKPGKGGKSAKSR